MQARDIGVNINWLFMSYCKFFKITMKEKWRRRIIEGEGYIEEAC